MNLKELESEGKKEGGECITFTQVLNVCGNDGEVVTRLSLPEPKEGLRWDK